MTTYTTVFGNDAIPPSTSGYSALVLATDVILFWPELAQGDLLATDIIDITSDADHTITLPSAAEVSVGRSLLLNNLSAFTVTIEDAVGTTVATMLPGNIKNIYLTDNTSTGGLWRVYTFGTGTSAADAAGLAGYGLSVIAGDLAQTSPAKITAGSAIVLVSDRAGTYIFKASGMATCALPSAFAAGDGFFLNVVNQGTGAVTLDPDSSETIDGLFTRDLAPGESATVVCDGTNWVTVGYGRSTQFQFTKLVLDITTGSPFTLTSTQAENKLLQFIGTPTAPVIVNLPAVVAVYYVECAFAGAFLLRLQTAAGAGVYASGTDRIIIYCDGVDVVFAQTTGLPATALAGGTAGAVVYQSAVDITGFTLTGVPGDLLRSFGTGKPYFQAPYEFLITRTSPTGSATIPAGTTLERDAVPQPGYDRFNTTIGKKEYWNGTAWVMGGGAAGGGSDDVFYENAQIVTTNYTITSGKNAMSAGKITINAGVTVTIPPGSTWRIV